MSLSQCYAYKSYHASFVLLSSEQRFPVSCSFCFCSWLVLIMVYPCLFLPACVLAPAWYNDNDCQISSNPTYWLTLLHKDGCGVF